MTDTTCPDAFQSGLRCPGPQVAISLWPASGGRHDLFPVLS